MTSAELESIVWEGRPRRVRLQASDWVFYAQYFLVLGVAAWLVPDPWLSSGPLRLWRGMIPLAGLALIALHWAHLRSRRLAVGRHAVWWTAGVGLTRVQRIECPNARVATGGARAELRGDGGVRVSLAGFDAVDLGAIRAALEGTPERAA